MAPNQQTITPPGPKARTPMGHLFAFYSNNADFMMGLARRYGDIVGFRIGRQKCYFLNSPDYIKDLLVTNHKNFGKLRDQIHNRFIKSIMGEGILTVDDEERHRRQRRLVQPAFHRQRINTYAEVMTDYTVRLRDRWEDGTTVEMAEEMSRHTLALTYKTLFNSELDKNEAKEAYQAVTDLIGMCRKAAKNPLIGLLEKFHLSSGRLKKVRDRLQMTIGQLINDYRASGEDKGDLLSMLLLARDEENNGGGLTDKQVRDEVMTIFMVGHETSSVALTWTWYALSQHPDVEAKLHAELSRVLGDRVPTALDLPQLTYTRMVFSEALRLYPPAYFQLRVAHNDCKFDNYFVPAGSLMFISQYVMHRDPRYYSNPDKFDPQRWTPEAQAKRPQFAYFPFGGGPRSCIGDSFAWMEAVLTIATLAQRWKIRLFPGHPVVPEPTLLSLRPQYGLPMILERRKQNSNGHLE